ncbi:MAG TPA: hypothetical protein VGH04_11335 [Gemmatimonadaceae bacterium]|jgi:hypothetical protein
MSPFAGYLFGLVVLVAGLAVAAYLLNVPTAAVIAAAVVALVALGAWATRRPRARPSKFSGATTNAPTLDRAVLMELKTSLMEQADAGRSQPTTRVPPASDSRAQPTKHIERRAAVPKPKPPSSDDA